MIDFTTVGKHCAPSVKLSVTDVYYNENHVNDYTIDIRVSGTLPN